MTLTFGMGPFGPHPAGQFNFTRRGPDTVLYWDDYPKRVRVEFNGSIIADSRRMKALHETGHLMVVYFPREDVDLSLLVATDHHTEGRDKGTASYWSVRVDGRVAKNAVWSYENPVESAPAIAGYMSFVHEQMDAWYQEEERVYAHLRDPYHRFDVHRSSRHVVVRHDGVVVAESRRPWMLFETGTPVRYYLPPEEVRTDLIEQSETVSHCPYKGDGQHWHLRTDGDRVEDAAWSLPDPLGEAQRIAGCICFYPEKVDTEVDGERLAR
jgi:uncharacterized protein (DUF427 family)